MSALAEVAAAVRASVAELAAVVAALYSARTKLEHAWWDPGRADESAPLVVRAVEALAHYSPDAMGFPLLADSATSSASASDNSLAPPAPRYTGPGQATTG